MQIRIAILVGFALLAICCAILTSWTGDDSPSAWIDLVWVMSTSGPLAVVWLLAAAGYGWPIRRFLFPDAETARSIQIGAGIAVLLILDAAFGALGLPNALGTWIVTGIGVAMLVMQGITRDQSRPFQLSTRSIWLLLTAIPAIAVLIVAACSAPGWLWESEFGGYDALSYHLQLPREWLALGVAAPLEHNVYSFLPGYVESAYLHIMAMRGDALQATYACQLLHAGMTITGAILIGRATLLLTSNNSIAAIIAAVIAIGTPWAIVVGSLAYNEMAVNLLFATGLLIVFDDGVKSSSRAFLIGVILGAAVGAKLTAVGFVAAPVLLILAVRERKRLLFVLPLVGVGMLVALAPYLIRNTVAIGNPVFPFLTSIFGDGHWSAEQIAIWRNGHAFHGGVIERLTEAWRQLPSYGFGTNPDATGFEPWKPQWSLLPWLAIAAGVILALTKCDRKGADESSERARNPLHSCRGSDVMLLFAVMFAQIVFWMFFTHIKSRFMVPLIVPGSLVIGLAAASVSQRFSRTQVAIVSAPLLLFWSCIPVWIYSGERNNAPSAMVGRVELQTGNALTAEQREDIGRAASPIVLVNHRLPDGARVYLIGDAAPLYYTSDVTYQTTWDRGVLSRAIAEYPNQPQRWIESLRNVGFTHLLVEPNMLQRWSNAGWNNPQLTVERVIDAADRFAERLLVGYPSDIRIYDL